MVLNKKIIKVVFRHYKKEGNQQHLDEAFDLLFEELLKTGDRRFLLN
jgi:hypothetical protein